ncbi:Metal-dependent hydrolase YbeY, involved in rRNA and/or ribosome maturation and assembly [Candidatus Syntrophocurvum alkaliphilum]|uniref:Endoribonuclease YbeY n=1 Tax=Candidatus Syntrophocurvum alkaliphilum TaxID=2293317 RepID=A0A6I6DJW6_9FIRM|nr:rRNA maturation RNase YbeY [Candidatus Syntrophocurvum alkaliphilum]QGT99984.1 Metal-dependent hydrolase YbeY, involved in rRNA and/or ribosome maturation and assembly [Candidatus Syntrophocurvum alkaliphilum]
MEIMIINQQSKVNYTKQIQQIIKKVIKTTANKIKLSPNSEVSILLVDNSYIQELNFIYRKINQPTDVLSFAMNELTEDEPDFDFTEDLNVLGDIVISLEMTIIQSEEYQHSFERELAYLVVHGMLHLLGYDHELDEERLVMRELEEKILKSIKLER